MPTTPRLALPYPAETDPASDGAADLQALALAVEAAMPRTLAVITATGDSSAGATEAIDSATAPYSFVAVAGRTYSVEAIGQAAMSTVAGDSAYLRLKAAAGAAVVAGSPTIQAHHIPSFPAAGTGGKTSVGTITGILRCPADIAAGQVTVGLFRSRGSGTGNITLSAPSGAIRQLVVTDRGVS